MTTEFGPIYGSAETRTGLVKSDAYIDEVTRHLKDETARQTASRLVRQLMSELPQTQEFCVTSNEVGAALERQGEFELAIQCFEWSYGQSDSLPNFLDPNVNIYGGNIIRAMQTITMQPQITGETRDFLKGKKGLVTDIHTFLGLKQNYLLFERAYNQIEQQGGINWNGDENQTRIVDVQTLRTSAQSLVNLL